MLVLMAIRFDRLYLELGLHVLNNWLFFHHGAFLFVNLYRLRSNNFLFDDLFDNRNDFFLNSVVSVDSGFDLLDLSFKRNELRYLLLDGAHDSWDHFNSLLFDRRGHLRGGVLVTHDISL